MRQHVGQAEFAILLGILIIAAAIVVFTFAGVSPLSPPAARSAEERQLRAIVTAQAIDAAQLTLRRLEATGGSLAPPSGGALYRGYTVNYWQACSRTAAPDLDTQIEPQLSAGIAAILKDRLPSATRDLGKPVSFDFTKLSVRANLVDGKADLTIQLPATLDSDALDPTYTTTVATDYKQLHAFASDLATELATNRPYEQYTISSLYLSSLPTAGVFTRCGEKTVITPFQLSARLQSILTYTIANTYWWQPFRPVGAHEPKTYSIETVNGRSYGFTPTVSFPDNFAIQTFSPVILTNNDFLATGILFFVVPYCVSVYNQRYSLDFPLVFSVPDSALGTQFNIATFASVKDMEPRPTCSFPAQVPEACNLGCFAKLTVADTANQPLPNITAVYGSCYLGTTNESGTLEGPIPCGTHELKLLPQKNTTELYISPVSADAINTTHILWERTTVNVSFLMAGINTSCFANDTVSASCNRTVRVPDADLSGTREVRVPPNYSVCTFRSVDNVPNRFVLINITSLRTGSSYPVTDLQTLPQAGTLLQTEEGRRACVQNPSSCIGTSLPNVTVDYLPAGPATLDAELRLIGLANQVTDAGDLASVPRWVQGAIRTSLDIPQGPSNLSVIIPRASESNVNEYTDQISKAGRINETKRLRTLCGMEPASLALPTTHRYSILRRGASCFTCAEARSVLEQSPFLLSTNRLDSLFTQRCSIGPTGNLDVFGNPEYGEVCIWACNPNTIKAYANQTLNARMDPICT